MPDDELRSAGGKPSHSGASGPSKGDVTVVLSRIELGEPQAADQLMPLVYEELRKLAAAKMAQEKPDQTLQATALVHEAYMRLVGDEQAQCWSSRGHFFAAAAEAMRRILVEQARRKAGPKAGGDLERHDIQDVEIHMRRPPVDILALHEALDSLALKDPRKAELVQAAVFAGMSNEQAAEVLGTSRLEPLIGLGLRQALGCAWRWRTERCGTINQTPVAKYFCEFSSSHFSANSRIVIRAHDWRRPRGACDMAAKPLDEEADFQAGRCRFPLATRAGITWTRRAADDDQLRQRVGRLLIAHESHAVSGTTFDRHRRHHRPAPSPSVSAPRSVLTSSIRRSAKGAWASSTWPCRRSRSGAKWR